MIRFFYADWCAPCKSLKAALTEEDLEGVVFVNVDHEPDMVKSLGIYSIPTIIKYDEFGEEIDRNLGNITRKSFLEFKNG